MCSDVPARGRSPEASSLATRKTMQSNRGKNTKPEIEMRRHLRAAGFPGYRIHWRSAPGCPDVAYPGRKVAVFVHGCFWHRCPHCNPPSPKTHSQYWQAKFNETADRDLRALAALESAGWTVFVVWECQLRATAPEVVANIVTALRKDNSK